MLRIFRTKRNDINCETRVVVCEIYIVIICKIQLQILLQDNIIIHIVTFFFFADYGYGTDDSTKKAGLGYSPDITHHVTAQSGGSGGGTVGSSSSHSNNGNTHGHITPTTVCYEYSYPDSNSNHSKSGFLRPLSEHHYEQPMVVLPPSQSPSDSLGKK